MFKKKIHDDGPDPVEVVKVDAQVVERKSRWPWALVACAVIGCSTFLISTGALDYDKDGKTVCVESSQQ